MAEPLHLLPSSRPARNLGCPPGFVDVSTRHLAAALLRRLADPRQGAPAAVAFLARLATQQGPGWVRQSLPPLLDWLGQPCVAAAVEAPPAYGHPGRTVYGEGAQLRSRSPIAAAHPVSELRPAQPDPEAAEQDQRGDTAGGRTGGSAGASAALATWEAAASREGCSSGSALAQNGCSGDLVLCPRLLSLPAQLRPRLRQLLAAIRRCPSLYDYLDVRDRMTLQYLLALLTRRCSGGVGGGVGDTGGRAGAATKAAQGGGGSAGWAREWVSAAIHASRLRYQRSVRHPAPPPPAADLIATATAAATAAALAGGGGSVPGLSTPAAAAVNERVAGFHGRGNGLKEAAAWREARMDSGTAVAGADAGVAGAAGGADEGGGDASGVGPAKDGCDGWWWVPMPMSLEACDLGSPGGDDRGDADDEAYDGYGWGSTHGAAYLRPQTRGLADGGLGGDGRGGEPAAPAAPEMAEAAEGDCNVQGLVDSDDGWQLGGTTRATTREEDAAASPPAAKRTRREAAATATAAGTAAADPGAVANPPQQPPRPSAQTGRQQEEVHQQQPEGGTAAMAGVGGDTAESLERAWSEVVRLLKDAVATGRDGPPPTWQPLEALLERCAAYDMPYGTASASASSAAAQGPALALAPDGVLYIVRQLLTPRLSGAAARLLLTAVALPAVAAVDRVMPKPLQEALAAAAGPHPRPLTEAVLAPAARQPGLAAGQAQLLIKTCTTGPHALPRPLQALVLRSAASAGQDWCEAHVAAVQGLVEAAGGELDMETLAVVVNGLCAGAQSPPLLRSASLWRLLLSVLTKYGTALNVIQLRRLYDAASATTNFMTKPCLSKLQELLRAA